MLHPFISVQELRNLLATKKISIKEVVSFYLNRIKKYDGQLNSVLEAFYDQENIDTAPEGILHGIPCLLKDNICQHGRIASAASKILSNYKAPYNATVTDRLKKEGSIVIGRTNMDEFAMGSSGEFSAYGATKNPWDLTRVPGGSCSGSAAAVAAGLVPYTIGTETGGSIRTPAAFCNLTGIYPTYGLVPRYGIIALASSTDQAGPFTRTVYDNALVLSSLAGMDQNDPTSQQIPKKDYTATLDGALPKNLKIGIIRESLEAQGIDEDVRKAFNESIKQLKKLGATCTVIDIPKMKYGIALYFIISRAEAASNLYRYDGSLYGARVKEVDNLVDMYLQTRGQGLGSEPKRRTLVGNYVLSAGHKDAYYKKALIVRDMLRTEFENTFKSVDVLISPTTPTTAFKLGALVNDPIKMYLTDYFTVPNCIIGTPALSVPCGMDKENLPIGMQFFGPRLSEELLYKVAHAFQVSTDHHLKTPRNYD